MKIGTIVSSVVLLGLLVFGAVKTINARSQPGSPSVADILRRSDQEMVAVHGLQYSLTTVAVDVSESASSSRVEGAATTKGVLKIRNHEVITCLWGSCPLGPKRLRVVFVKGRAAEKARRGWVCSSGVHLTNRFKPGSFIFPGARTRILGLTTWHGAPAWTVGSVYRTSDETSILTLVIGMRNFRLFRTTVDEKLNEAGDETDQYQWMTLSHFGPPRPPITLPAACRPKAKAGA